MNDFEVEPLGMTFGIDIVFKPQIIFYVINFNGSTKIARFKTWLKNQNIFLSWNVNCVLMARMPYYIIFNLAICCILSLRGKFWQVFE